MRRQLWTSLSLRKLCLELKSKGHEISYPVVHDNRDKMWPSYGLTGLPETFFVDPRGRVVGHVSGQISAADLRRGIEKALKT